MVTREGSIPTGLCLKAQGCEERATLGKYWQPGGASSEDEFSRRVAGVAAQTRGRMGRTVRLGLKGTTPLGLRTNPTVPTQGSSMLATLGFVAESLWDSPAP